MARLTAGHINQYKPGTRQERGYICGILSIYKDDFMADAAILAANVMSKSIIAEKKDIINSTKVYIQDTEYNL